MGNYNYSKALTSTVERLSEPKSLEGLFHRHTEGNPLPSGKVLEEIIELSRAIIFPGYFGKSSVNTRTIKFHIGANVEKLYKLLSDQIMAGLCFACETCPDVGVHCRDKANDIAARFIERLPDIRQTLATDVDAAYNGDPAAVNVGEIISCYPVIKALTNYRIAHELHIMGVPLIPRIITEMAHSETGIDIHPAATIGHHFTIDHGTGVVVGANMWVTENMEPKTKKNLETLRYREK